MAGTGMEVAGGLAAAAKLLKALKDLVSAPDAKAQVIELYDVILSTQAGALELQARERALLEEIAQLKEKLVRVGSWAEQKLRYRLVTPYSGVTVYALLKSESNGEPPHYICANCFESGKRSVIQHVVGKDKLINLACSACRSEGHTRYRGIGPAKYAEEVVAE